MTNELATYDKGFYPISEHQHYFLTDDGSVYSNRKGDMRKLKPQSHSCGYLIIRLGKETTTQYVHRLMAKTFLFNPYKLSDVNHKNGIKTDNRIENLEWMSRKENCKHAFRTGLAHISPETKSKANKAMQLKYSKPIEQLDLEGNLICRFDSANDAARKTNIHLGSISKVVRGERKIAGKYKWRYAI